MWSYHMHVTKSFVVYIKHKIRMHWCFTVLFNIRTMNLTAKIRDIIKKPYHWTWTSDGTEMNQDNCIKYHLYFHISIFIQFKYAYFSLYIIYMSFKNRIRYWCGQQNCFLYGKIKVLDASGHVAPGFVWGNNFWLGSKKACQFINKRAPVILSHEFHKNHFKNLTYIESPFPVEYKLVWAKHSSRWQVDISTFEKVIASHFNRFFFFQKLFNWSIFFFRLCCMLVFVCRNLVQMKMLTDWWIPCWIAKSLAKNTIWMNNFPLLRAKPSNYVTTFSVQWWWTFFCTLYFKFYVNYVNRINLNVCLFHNLWECYLYFRCILVLNLVFVTIGSIYMNFSSPKTDFNKSVPDIKKTNNNQIKCSNINAVLNVDNAMFNQQVNKTKRKNSIVERFFSCFCVVKNSEIITTESLGTDSIEVIHGMR